MKSQILVKFCDLILKGPVYMYLRRSQHFLSKCVLLKKHQSPVQTQICHKKVQVGKDQEKAQSEKDSHSKNRGGKKPN